MAEIGRRPYARKIRKKTTTTSRTKRKPRSRRLR
jgi:hypothetical protein